MPIRRAPVRASAVAVAVAVALAVVRVSAGPSYANVAPQDPGRILPAGDAMALGAPDDAAVSLVGLAVTPSGRGYWALAGNGNVFAFGDARAVAGAVPAAVTLVDIAGRGQGDGYWVAAADGGVFSYGAAGFFGSLGGIALNSPVTAMAATPSGKGYWLVAADGGVFAFGDARFHGSLGAMVLNSPVTAMAATPSGRGYWMVATDGGVFAFGDAAGHGRFWADGPVADLAARPDGAGYWAVVAHHQPVLSGSSTGWEPGEPTDEDFDRLAVCESGGRWDLNSGNGYFGGLQFSLPTWRGLGGSGFPHEHSREGQIEMARRQWRRSVWRAWPVCGRLLS